MFFEDFHVGQSFNTDSRSVTQEEIIDFASQWDKQSFHLDPDAAKESIYGGLIASGFQTLLITFDLVVATGVWTDSSRGSPGMADLRWILPVRPGDTLSAEFEVVDVKASTTRGDRGYVTWDHRTLNQDGQVVMTFRSTGINLRRSPLPDPT